ncbi:MAG TPA: S-layer homology domain-containing protein [Candidatus Aquicultor sp.]
MIRNKSVSLLIVVAMVISMLPLGALAALAASTPSPSSPTAKVITGAGATVVKNQATDNITIKENSAAHDEWNGPVTIKVEGNVGAAVKFNVKPTVTVNGTALAASQITFAADRTNIQFTIDGDNTKQDVVVISNVKVDLGIVAAGPLDMKCSLSGAVTETLHSFPAKVQNGLIFSCAAVNTALKTDTNNQAVVFQFDESATGTVEKDDILTVTAPAGVTFYEPPVATIVSGTGFGLYSLNGSLNADRTQATWQVSAAATSPIKITFAANVNVAASFAADADVNFTSTTNNTGYAVAPASVKVAKTTATDALTFEAAAAPTISNSINQAAAGITISESKASSFAGSDTTLTVQLLSGTFASSPVGTPSGAGLTLKNASGDAVTTGLPGNLTTVVGFQRATWTIADQSTAAGKISISNIAVNASGLTDGAVQVKIYGTAVGIPTIAGAKVLTIANVNSSQTVKLSAVTTPALMINAANQAGGDVLITETKAGALTAGLVTLHVFGNSADKEVLLGQAPTVSVSSGDITISNVTLAAGSEDVTFTVTQSTKASTIKISGIKYDINSKAKAGAIQLLVTNAGTRIGTVSDATIGTAVAKFSDVPATFWAFNAIDYLASQSIISGRTSGLFDPSASITRAEFAKIVCLAAGLKATTPSTASFSDISGNWAAGYIEAAKAAGIIGGYTDGTFRPNNKITRAEIAKMVVTGAKYTVVTSGASFTDISSNWAKDFIVTAAVKGVVSGYTDGTFKPGNNATRAEASQMIFKWLVP